MKRTFYLTLPLLFVSLFALRAAAQANNDFLLVPGERAGPIHATTTGGELRSLFGDTQVVDKAVPGPEGEPVNATIVFPHTLNRITIFYRDTAHTHIESVRVETLGGRWHTPEGVGVNTPLATLIRLNRNKKIYFFGFDWDYGGSITDWGGGPLAATLGRGGRAILQLGYAAARNASLTARQKAQISGEKTIASDDPALRVLQPFVQSLNLTLDEDTRSSKMTR